MRPDPQPDRATAEIRAILDGTGAYLMERTVQRSRPTSVATMALATRTVAKSVRPVSYPLEPLQNGECSA